MKMQLMRFAHKNLTGRFFKATVIVMILSGGQYVNAQALAVSAPVERPHAETPKAEVRHIDSDGETALFEVKVENTEGSRFKVIIKQADGTVLFQNAYSDKSFTKKYSIPRSESDNLIFVIKGLSGSGTETFEVNSNAHYVEDVVVRKVM